MPPSASTSYRFGPFEVNAATGELLQQGKRIKLQEQPFRLLVILLENAGAVVTRAELRAHIWPKDTFVDFDGSLRVAVRKLREALGDDADHPHYIETLPKRGYRFLGPAIRQSDPPTAETELAPVPVEVPLTTPTQSARTAETPAGPNRRLKWLTVSLLVLAALGASTFFSRSSNKTVLTEKDTVVLADFVNSTGDPLFDNTLRQGLAEHDGTVETCGG